MFTDFSLLQTVDLYVTYCILLNLLLRTLLL